MAIDQPSPTPDPVEEEIRRLLTDPEVTADLNEYVTRKARGQLGPGISHEEFGSRLGLLTGG